MSVGLHGESALEDVVHIDTTVHEKNITYPTDSKLAIKIISCLNKISTAHDNMSTAARHGSPLSQKVI